MKELRIAICGCGRMGQERAARAAALGARVVAVYDSDPAAAATLAARHPGCEVSGSPFQWREADAVFVCTPPHARGVVEVEALRRNVPVFVEKPIGLTADGWQRIVADYPADCLTAVGYMNRYRTSVEVTRDALAGRVVLGAMFHWAVSPYRVAWWPLQDRSGGPFNEQGTHLMDLARYLLGEVIEVQALTAEPISVAVTTRVACTLRFETGSLGTLLYSCEAATKLIGIRVLTPEVEFVMQGWDFRLEPNEVISAPPPPDPDRTAIFAKETATFLQAVADGNPSLVRCDFREAYKTQRTVDAVRRAMASGGRVRSG